MTGPMRKIPPSPPVSLSKPKPPPPPPPRQVAPKTLAFDEPIPAVEKNKSNLDKLVESHGEPIGMHSGKTRRGSRHTKNVEGDPLKIPVDYRDAYAAFFHMTAACQHMETVQTYFAGSPGLHPTPGVSPPTVAAALKAAYEVTNALFIALGMDKEHNIPFHVRRQDTFMLGCRDYDDRQTTRLRTTAVETEAEEGE